MRCVGPVQCRFSPGNLSQIMLVMRRHELDRTYDAGDTDDRTYDTRDTDEEQVCHGKRTAVGDAVWE